VALAWKNWFHRPSSRTLFAIACGLLWAAAFPLIHLPLAAWLAPGALLLTGVGVRPGHSARLGYLAGLIHFSVSLYWLLHIPFAVGNVAAWVSLSAYCALFPTLWMWICWKTFPTGHVAINSDHRRSGDEIRAPASHTFREASQRCLSVAWMRRQVWILFCAISWTALEFTRGWFLTGFPWNFLGASQFRSLPFIQVAEFTGTIGVTFLVVWTSCSLAFAILLLITQPQARFAWKNELGIPFVVMLSVMSWGVMKTMQPPSDSDRTLRLAMVQPSIPQTLIFDTNEATNRFRQIMNLSREALASEPDVLVWPEASLPASLSQDYVNEISEMVIDTSTPIILGKLDFDVIRENGVQRYQPYNAAVLLDENARLRGVYRKQRLVIFGEYTPFAKHLPFLARLFPAGVGFGSGKEPEPFIVGDEHANISVNICFEDNFSDVVRDQVHPDTDFVLNLTNNGWFSESAAQWQHAANAVFRAVENRVPLVRVTNNGLSCWIDEFGRLREVFTDENGSVYGDGFQTFEIPLRGNGEQRPMTLYHRRGDWFGWGCFWVTIGVLGITMIPGRS
jgi:apolipoprotein N-acyltransferase